MPHLVIVSGAPGTGKSTLVDYLQSKLEIPALSKDDIKEFLFDKLGAKDREWSRLIGRVSVEMFNAFARQFLETGKDLMIENAFWAELARPELKMICEKTHTTCLELHCFTDISTRSERNRLRLQNGSRHPGHVDEEIIFNEAADVVRYKPLDIGKVIMIDTTNLPKAGYDEIANRVETFLKRTKE